MISDFKPDCLQAFSDPALKFPGFFEYLEQFASETHHFLFEGFAAAILFFDTDATPCQYVSLE
jgi:hypothetical protein